MSNFRFFLLVVIFLTGCICPRYSRPPTPVPEEWRFQSDEGNTLCNIDWWKELGDPVLNEYIVLALRNNQDLKAAIARVFQFGARLGVTNSFRFPEIDANALYTRTKSSIALATTPTIPLIPGLDEGVGFGIPRIFDDYQLFLSLDWELDFWGRLSSATQGAYFDLLGQIQARRAVAITVVTSVARSYIRLRQLDAQLEIARQTLASRQESLDLAKFRFELGETSQLEVKQAEGELELAAIRMTEFERDIPIQENLLSVILGESPRSVARGSPLDGLRYPPEIPAGLPSDLLSARPDIVQAEDNLISANANVTKARALFFPRFNLSGLYGAESNLLENLFTSPANMWQYALTAVEPIFNAGRTVFQVQEAKAIRAELLFKYRQTILNALREVNDAFISYKKNKELVEEHQRQVRVLGEYLRLAQLRYLEGEIDYLNVLDAQRSLFDAQLGRAQALADSFIALVQLYSALGGGWVVGADSIAIAGEECVIEQTGIEIENKI